MSEDRPLFIATEALPKEEHRRRHVELHKAFDELVADWIAHTGKLPSKSSVLELMDWSAQQTKDPS